MARGTPAWPAPAPTLAALLVAHFEAHQRDLPWRHTRDPFAIWVSEVMLQQTQVEVVLRYYARFLARFPDATTLANASQQDVLSAWSGLGYYRRARLMHRAAGVIRDEHGGEFPRDPAAIRRLPGVGAYTQGALTAIALHQPAAAVDGNVNRVLSRLLGQRGDPTAKDNAAVISAAALELSTHAHPSSVVQGLMELGATVCLPSGWKCGACPWQQVCRARAANAVDEIPPPKVRPARKTIHVGGALVLRKGQVAMVPAGQDGLLAGLWQLPATAPLTLPKSAGATAQQTQVRTALVGAWPRLKPDGLLCTTRRTLTHRELVVWVFETSSRAALPAGTRWVPLESLREAPLSAAWRAALKDALAAKAERA